MHVMTSTTSTAAVAVVVFIASAGWPLGRHGRVSITAACAAVWWLRDGAVQGPKRITGQVLTDSACLAPRTDKLPSGSRLAAPTSSFLPAGLSFRFTLAALMPCPHALLLLLLLLIVAVVMVTVVVDSEELWVHRTTTQCSARRARANDHTLCTAVSTSARSS